MLSLEETPALLCWVDQALSSIHLHSTLRNGFPAASFADDALEMPILAGRNARIDLATTRFTNRRLIPRGCFPSAQRF